MSLTLSQIFDVLGAEKTSNQWRWDSWSLVLGLPFFAVAMVGTSLMRAAGDVATPGYLMAVGSFCRFCSVQL